MLMGLLWLVLGWFASLSAAEATMTLLLNSTFVGKDDVTKMLVFVFAGPLEAFELVCLSNYLAVGAAAKGPSQQCSTAKDGTQTHAATSCDEQNV